MSSRIAISGDLRDPIQWDNNILQTYLDELNRQHDDQIVLDDQTIQESMNREQTVSMGELMSRRSSFIGTQKRKKNDCARESNISQTPYKMTKLGLKKVLKEQKIKAIVNNFQNKIKRNATRSVPVIYQPFEMEQSSGFWLWEGVNIPIWLDLGFSFLSIIQILVLFFVYTLSLVFDELIQNTVILNLQRFSMCFFAIEIMINFVAIKNIHGRKLITLKDIGLNYLKNKFFVDLICLVILIIDNKFSLEMTKFFRLCVMLKIGECFVKMEKIQNFFLTNFYKEQYWALIKVFLVNFAFAHVLAILLIAMTGLSDRNTWLHKINAHNDPWYEQYAWAYYWGTTTMLTVGFGDLTPANYKEAICLTLIQTFSCILLAYNINCVGTLISNIRSQNVERSRSLKIMRRLAQENNIRQDLEWSVCHYINQSDKMRKKFQHETDREFIKSLPEQLKGQFLKESNIKVFKNLGFFQNLTEKTLLALAEQIEMRIAHPEEIIFKAGESQSFMILRDGEVAYCTKIAEGKFHHTIIDQIKISKKDSPCFLHMNFIDRNTNHKYEIKSLKYSMIASLGIEKLVDILKYSACDFENFCQLRDKSKHIPDQFQILNCILCDGKHSKMYCPKVHYIPFHQMVIFKELDRIKKGRCSRKPRERISYTFCWNPLKRYESDLKNYQMIIYGKRMNEKKVRSSSRSVRSSYSSGYGGTQKISSTYKSNKIEDILREMSMPNESVEQTLKKAEQDKFFAKMQDKIIEAIKTMKDKGESAYEKGSMNLETDQLHNFNFYFPKSNPMHLIGIPLHNNKNQQDNEERKESGLFAMLTLNMKSTQNFFSDI